MLFSSSQVQGLQYLNLYLSVRWNHSGPTSYDQTETPAPIAVLTTHVLTSIVKCDPCD